MRVGPEAQTDVRPEPSGIDAVRGSEGPKCDPAARDRPVRVAEAEKLANARTQSVGSNEQVGDVLGRRAAGRDADVGVVRDDRGDRRAAANLYGGGVARGSDKHRQEVGAMQREIRRAPTTLSAIERHAHEDGVVRSAHRADSARRGCDLADRVQDADPRKDAGRIGGELEAGAEFLERVGALVGSWRGGRFARAPAPSQRRLSRRRR